MALVAAVLRLLIAHPVLAALASSLASFCDFKQAGKCFLYDDTHSLNLSSAIMHCASLNLTLTTISSKLENEVLKSMLGVGDSWINALATDFSSPDTFAWTKFHSRCRLSCCGVFVSGDGVWKDDACSQPHGVVCQKFVLTSSSVVAPLLRKGKTLSPADQHHPSRPVLHVSRIRQITPVLMLFGLFFGTSCIVFACLSKARRTYSTTHVSATDAG